MKEIRISSCPLNCFDVCGFRVEVEDGKVLRVEGNPEHPVAKGQICGKGRMLADRINHKDRTLAPLKKVNGNFIEISWEQALDEIAEKMLEIRERFGPTAVLHCYDYANGGLLKNLEQRFFNGFGGMTEVVGSLCWAAGIAAQTYDFGEVLSHAPEDLLNSKTIVVWGRNVTVTNMHLYPFIKEARKKGANLVVIDPNRNQIAREADLHIVIPPGMDGALALLLCKRIVDLNLADWDFIERYTYGFAEFRKVLDDLDEEWLLELCQLEREQLRRLVELVTQKPMAILLGYGMQRYRNGGNTIRAIDALGAVTGNIGIEGGGVNYGNKRVGGSFNHDALTLPGRRKAYRTFVRATQADEILAAADPPIQMLFVTRSNPLIQVPDANKTYEAFSRIPFKVVIDMFLTDTALLADYVLPCTTVFEEEDLYYSSMWHGYINYAPAIVPPYGQSKPDREIFAELARRMGFGELFDYTVDQFLEMGISHLAPYGITLERLKKEYTVRLPLDPVPWRDRKFSTPSGKFEFYSERARKDGLLPTAVLAYPAESELVSPELARKYPYQLLTIHPLRSLHSQNFHLIKRPAYPSVDISEEIANRLQIRDGDLVRLYNDRGSWQGIARIRQGIHPTTLFIEEGWWKQFGDTANQLTPNRLSDMGNGSAQYDCRVALEKVEKGA